MPDRALVPDCPCWASKRCQEWTAWPGPSTYLRAFWVPRAGGGGMQPPAGELPHGGHCACSDVTLRVLQELLGELGHVRGQERMPEVGLSWGSNHNTL